MWAALQISLPAACSQIEPNDKPVASARELKVPEPHQTLQFARPWDLLVPAKSGGKVSARFGLSKKFNDARTSENDANATALRAGRSGRCGLAGIRSLEPLLRGFETILGVSVIGLEL